MYGIDISHYQKDIDIKSLNSDFVIVKATEGIGYTDPSFTNFCSQLEQTDKLVGFYHFARPDKRPTISGMQQEAQWFLDVVQSTKLFNQAILILDWEKEPFNNESLVKAWLKYIEKETCKIPFVYGSRSKLNSWKDWSILDDYPIWMAIWPNKTRYEEGVCSGLSLPTAYFQYEIWQYSNVGYQKGKNFNIDLDYTDMTREDWLKHFAKYIKENISADMQWAIENDLFIGYPDGLYYPKDPVTREQLASVLHRYNKKFGGDDK